MFGSSMLPKAFSNFLNSTRLRILGSPAARLEPDVELADMESLDDDAVEIDMLGNGLSFECDYCALEVIRTTTRWQGRSKMMVRV